MAQENQQFSVFAHSVKTVTFQMTDGTNVTGWTIKWVLTDEEDNVLLTKTVGSGLTLTTPASGLFTLSLTADDTDLTPGVYFWETKRTDDNLEETLATGTMIVNKSRVAYP